MLTNRQISHIAMTQSATDIGCCAEDFCRSEPVVVNGVIGEGARVYYKAPISCHFVTYGHNVVASVIPELRDIVTEYVDRHAFYRVFETPQVLWLNERVSPLGHKLCYMAYYFLPDLRKLTRLPCPYEMRLLHPADFAHLYTPEWGNALLAERRELDMLAYGAYDGDRLIGLAGCSADCESMWQIGIDVLPAYRQQGVASALTSHLALEILARDKVPFYCCSWANIPSAKNAAGSGFAPAWMELTLKPAAFVDELNGIFTNKAAGVCGESQGAPYDRHPN